MLRVKGDIKATYAKLSKIYVEDSIKDTGYKIIKTEEMMIAKLFPMKIVMAKLFWKEKR